MKDFFKLQDKASNPPERTFNSSNHVFSLFFWDTSVCVDPYLDPQTQILFNYTWTTMHINKDFLRQFHWLALHSRLLPFIKCIFMVKTKGGGGVRSLVDLRNVCFYFADRDWLILYKTYKHFQNTLSKYVFHFPYSMSHNAEKSCLDLQGTSCLATRIYIKVTTPRKQLSLSWQKSFTGRQIDAGKFSCW